jgi:CheY-like chemotaxis protein
MWGQCGPPIGEGSQMIKVLIVDDYREHIDTLVSTLNMYGCEARGAVTFADGIKMAKEWTPHLVVVDGLLETGRAWRFAFQLLNVLPASDRPYLVSLTGFGSTLQRRLCEECGCDEYVTKPIELSTLLGWVQKARERAEAGK